MAGCIDGKYETTSSRGQFLVNLEMLEQIQMQSWKEGLPEIVQGYKPVDIWHIDETGCFWNDLPDKGLGQMKPECNRWPEK